MTEILKIDFNYRNSRNPITRDSDDMVTGIHPEFAKGGLPSSDTVTPFIPVYHKIFHTLYQTEDKEPLVTYSKFSLDTVQDILERATSGPHPTHHNTVYKMRNYSHLINFLRSGSGLCEFTFTSGGLPVKVWVSRGFIQDTQGNVLLSLSITSNDFIPYTKHEVVLTPENCMIFVSKDLTVNPMYKSFYKKIQGYIEFVEEEGVDLLTTRNMDKWLYKVEDPIPTFKSVVKRKKYFNDLAESLFEGISN